VHAHRIDVGAVQQLFIGGGIVGADALDQLVLAQELRTAPGSGFRRRVLRLGGGFRRLGREWFRVRKTQYRSS
jgi:hypothetical protein